MNIAAVADTHAILWYVFASRKLSKSARYYMDNAAKEGLFIGVSTISLAEIVYLAEKDRIKEDAFKRIVRKLNDPLNVLVELSFNSRIVEFMLKVPRKDVPDFPDRIIAATAKSYDAPLITKDKKIRAADIDCIW